MPTQALLLEKYSDKSQLPALVQTPKNMLPGEQYVLLAFAHGIGEAGDGTLGQVYNLLQNPSAAGPHAFASAVDDFAFTNPIDGKVYKFIVVSMQGLKKGGNPWAPFASEIQYAIKNDLKKRYNINPNAVFITGLSAGGAEAANAITMGEADMFAAAVPMSQAGQGQNLQKAVDAGIKVWAFCGDVDWSYRPNAQAFVDKLNAIKPGTATLTLYANGHGGWNTIYNPTFKQFFNFPGGKKALNIYEWCLSNMKQGSPVVDTGSSTGGSVNQNTNSNTENVIVPVPEKPSDTVVSPPVVESPPIVPQPPAAGVVVAKAGPDVTIPAGPKYLLDASESVGQVGWWRQVGLLPSKVWFTAVPGSFGKEIVNGLVPGVYELEFVVQGKYPGQEHKDTMFLTVGNTPPARKIVKYILTAVYDDGSKDASKEILPENISIKQ